MAEARKENIYEKLATVRKVVEVVEKDRSGYGYKYVSDEELLSRITKKMEQKKLSLIPKIVPGTLDVEQYTYKKTKLHQKTKDPYDEINNEILVSADMVYVWVNNEDPSETVEVPWILVGQQSDASQSFGSALTYSYRYFLLKYFGVATVNDDPDDWRSKQQAAEAEQERLMTEEIINEFDKILRDYLEAHDGDKDDVLAFVSQYAKGGKYRTISEPAVAAKLLKDFRDKFLESKED